MSESTDKTSTELPRLDEQDIGRRRRFMRRTLNLTSVLAAAGLSESVLEAALISDATAAEPTLKRPIQAVPNVAIREKSFANAVSLAARDGNSARALKQFGGSMTAQQRQALQQLSPSDLKSLMNLKRKLGGGNAKCCDAGATIF